MTPEAAMPGRQDGKVCAWEGLVSLGCKAQL